MALSWHTGEAAGPDAVQVVSAIWIRNRRRTRTWSAITVAWSVVLAALLFRPGYLNGHLVLAGYLGLGAFYLGIAVLGLALAWRVARAGVWIGADAIVIRGPFRTQ